MTKRNKQSVREIKQNNKTKKGKVVAEKFVEERQRSIIPLKAQNDNQRKALKAFTDKQLVIQTGSAGTGKSELMGWWASKQWLLGNVDSIIITRPHKHLGEDYGAVKGNDAEKLLPFCMSILMKLKKYLGTGILRNNFVLDGFEDLFAEASGIQIVPIEKIQGISFNERTIILADEIQNATEAQVKSLTTRMEEGCQLLITGDPLQTALPFDTNGLSFLEKVVENNPHDDIEIIRYSPEDNCRKGVASHLTKAYEKLGNW